MQSVHSYCTNAEEAGLQVNLYIRVAARNQAILLPRPASEESTKSTE